MHTKDLRWGGKPLKASSGVLVLLHGRGATAEDILTLSAHLNVSDFTLVAPQATNFTWYPYSFLAPTAQNEPWLSSALKLLNEVVEELHASGVKDDRIFFAGFSQGACLTLEFVTRHARRWGGIAAFTGGLIGEKINTANYEGDFLNTPVYIGTSDPDPHVPVERVRDSADLLTKMKAAVTVDVFNGMGHTVSQQEVERANQLVFR